MAEDQPKDGQRTSASRRVDRDTPEAARAVQADRQDPAGKGPHQTEGGKTLTGKLVQFSGGLSTPFVTRPVMTVLLSLAIIAFGFFTYKLLPVNDLPAVDYPVINVSVSYPGASPETMANNIATPLEKQFLLIDGLELITSASTQSNTSLTLQFNLSKTLGRRGHRRAGGHPASHRPTADRPAQLRRRSPRPIPTIRPSCFWDW